ncbi:unnamed protein product [Oppiella nova]|uniref:Helicase ATP-binding domain-containing protein n=1 Tax=Oppiella nova TaxID=334625 RepID=A0A7R9L8B7_9ACAR|nr:unnamed protein product [Oppiella nova]CAG2158028.1 unnamed protein product [Oppiella nova]
MSSSTSSSRYKFPFMAYDIQEQLMDAMYSALDQKKVAIVESPTGTGKSLSIICATIQWIQDFHTNELKRLTRQLQTLNKEIERLDADSKVSSDWIELQDKKSMVCRQKEVIVKQLNAFDVKNQRNKALVDRRSNSLVRHSLVLKHKNVSKKLRTDTNCGDELSACDNETDEDFVDYCSDEEVMDEKVSAEESETFVRPKIYYASRTHSQLSQFIREIQRTTYSRGDTPLRAVPLGSRNNYCINDRVLRLNNNHLINEKCIELQNSSNSQTKCQFFKKSVMNELKDEVLADVLDIEDINKLGKGVKACPYYSTRLAIPEAEIVIMPYNVLLHSPTRQSYGIDLVDSVVVVDEAHNLMETIHNIHSIELKGSHVMDALTQLNAYLARYKTRLSARNAMHIKQIVFILNVFSKHFKTSAQNDCQSVCERVEFLIRLGIENLNLFQILDYCQKSQIARKLFGFSKRQQSVANDIKPDKAVNGTTAFLAKMKAKSIELQSIASNTSTPEEEVKVYGSPLYLIQEFLRALVNSNSNAKIITKYDKNSIRECCVKYILLNPFSQFKDIVSECRSVVLCGGTMKPFDEYIDHLFTPLGITSDRLLTFSCGHVIPDSHLLAVALGMGPNGKTLNYTFQNRTNNSMIEETGKTVVNMCAVIPDGIVCFFPSYELEDIYYKSWQKCGIIKSIESKGKTVFREPRKASMVHTILSDYNRAITGTNNRGALLLCVVGGKMSEGINFSDHLGRGVIVVGLPYANKQSLELTQKMQYLDSLKPNAGNVFYENLCLKAVNQSIGRAIRHKNDFAVIILLDNRYTNRQNIRQNLPDWIRARLLCVDSFPKAFSSIRQFFHNKQK